MESKELRSRLANIELILRNILDRMVTKDELKADLDKLQHRKEPVKDV